MNKQSSRDRNGYAALNTQDTILEEPTVRTQYTFETICVCG